MVELPPPLRLLQLMLEMQRQPPLLRLSQLSQLLLSQLRLSQLSQLLLALPLCLPPQP